MTFLVDTNVIIYSAVDCPQQQASVDILEAIINGAADGHTSTAVLEEVWHLELSRKVQLIEGLTERAHRIFAPLLAVTNDAFQVALAIKDSRLGANDRLHVGVCATNGIATICTADSGFDDVAGLSRVDPTDPQALSRLRRV